MPTSIDELKVLYKDSSSVINSYKDKVIRIKYGDYESEFDRKEALYKLENKYKFSKEIFDRIEKEHPDKVFEIQIDTYKSGGGANVEERSKWVVEQLKKTDNKQELINKLWDTKVLTSTASGTAAYIKEKYGIDVGKYTGTQKGLGTKAKVKKLTKITFKKLTAKKVAFKALGKKALPALKLKAAPKFKVKEPKTIKLKMPDKVLPAIKTPSANAFRLTVSR